VYYYSFKSFHHFEKSNAMGNLLSEPITEKETEEGITVAGLSYAASSMQGWRTHMEDAHICESQLTVKVPSCSNSFNNNTIGASSPIENEGGGGGEGGGNNDKNEMQTTVENHLPMPAAEAGPESPYEYIVLKDHSIFAVFDGHGGDFAAKYAAKHFVRVLTSLPTFQSYAMLCHESQQQPRGEDGCSSALPKSEQEASALKMKLYSLLEQSLRNAFYEIDNELLATCRQPTINNNGNNSRKRSIAHVSQQPNTTVMPVHGQTIQEIVREIVHRSEVEEEVEEEENADENLHGETSCGSSGTTAVVVLITPTQVLCANAGDSRAIFSKASGQIIPLSYDHKPSDEYELNRIVNAGGFVSNDRINGDLAVARGLGDFRFKLNEHLPPDLQKVTALPDIIILNRSMEEDLFIFMGCDGIWDVCSNSDVVEYMLTIFKEGESSLGLVCEEMMDICLHKGSKDNMTALMVALPGLKKYFEEQHIPNGTKGGGVFARRQERARLAEEARRARQNSRFR
jgi:serine/threonine protein phosphatase PrpC